jgi:tripeptide aminopeptidase
MAANALNAAALNELTDHRGVRECLQWFTREKQWINETHLQICRVPAPTFMEQERAAWFHDQFRGLGWNSSIDRAGNVIAASGEGPYVALTAHLDTVIAPRSKEDISVASDGRFQGPGVSDNGAGLAALLAVARVWKTCTNLPDLPLGLLLVANVGEEGEGNLLGMRHLCKQSNLARKIESFIVVDGASTEYITTRGLGSRRFEVAFTGPGGHSWSDYGVGNPVHALCRAVAFFSETRLEGLPKSSTNVGLIEGGSSVNAIPQTARAKVDIRSESNARMDELVELLTLAADRARDIENQRATGGKVSVKLKEIGSRPAAALPDQAPILQYLRIVDAHLGIRAHLDTSSTDANIPLSLGIPAVAIGAGGVGGGAHTTQE